MFIKNWKEYLKRISKDSLKEEYMLGCDTADSLMKAKKEYENNIKIINDLLKIYNQKLELIELEYNSRIYEEKRQS